MTTTIPVGEKLTEQTRQCFLKCKQARLAQGEYESVLQFVKDVRRVFKDASECAPADSELSKSAMAVWEDFEEQIKDHKLAKPQEVGLPFTYKRQNVRDYIQTKEGGRVTRKSCYSEQVKGGDKVDGESVNVANGPEKKRFFVRIKENGSDKEASVKSINVSGRAERV